MTESDEQQRPRYRVSADRSSARRRVRYVESNRQDDGECTLCQLDELAQREQQEPVPAPDCGTDRRDSDQ